MNRGYLIVVLIGVMLVMTLTAQNLKRLTPLLTSAATANAGASFSPQDREMLRQLGLQDTAADRSSLQNALSRLTQGNADSRFQQQYNQLAKQNTNDPTGDVRRLKNWLDSALAQAKQKAHSAPAKTAEPSAAAPAPAGKPVLEIYTESPAEITNPHFTARQLRRARLMLRELRQNNEDTADAIRQKFGAKAEEEARKIARQTETQAEKYAQNAQTWEAFENAFEKSYTQGETKLGALIKKYLK